MTPTLRIQDGPDVLHITFADVEKYHGQGSIAGAALAFMAMHAAFSSLYTDCTPSREKITIATGHPGPGVRDAFEFVTRAVSRNVYRVEPERTEARWNPYSTVSFTFSVSDTGQRRADISLKQDVLPHRFFELLDLERRGVANAENKQELRQLKRALADRILEAPWTTLFFVS